MEVKPAISGIQTLAEFAGLKQGDVAAMLAKESANRAKLDACAYHEFMLITPGPADGLPNYMEYTRYACRHCEGEVNFSAYRWHELGRRAKPA